MLVEKLVRALVVLGFEDASAELSGEEEPGWAFAEILADAWGMWCDHRHDVLEQAERLTLALNTALARAGAARKIAIDVDSDTLEVHEDRVCRRHELAGLGGRQIEEAFGCIAGTAGPDVVVTALVPYDDTDAHGFAVLTDSEMAACRDVFGEETDTVVRPLLGPALPERERVACEEVPAPAPAQRKPTRKRAAEPVPDRGLAHGYRVERGKVLDGCDYVVRRADPATFHPLAREWAVDADHVFFLGTIVEGLEARTFRPIDDDFGRDDTHVAYASTVLDVDPSTFRVLTGSRIGQGRWAKDATHVLWFESLDAAPKLIRGADAESFTALADEYARDRATVYWAGRKLPGARPAGWELLPGHHYSRDGKKVYYANDRVKEADGETLETFVEYLARDKEGFFCRGERIDRASVVKTIGNLFVFEGVLLGRAEEDGTDASSMVGLAVRVDRWVQQPRPGRNVPAVGETHSAYYRLPPDVRFEGLVGQPRYWICEPTSPNKVVFTLVRAGDTQGWEFGEPQHWPLVERWLAVGRT